MSLYIGDKKISVYTDISTATNTENKFISGDIEHFTNLLVTTIRDNRSPFAQNKNIKTVNIPNCINIGKGAFYSCENLIEATFTTCETIGDNAFRDCDNLMKVHIPSCLSIGNFAFQYCVKLREIILPNCIYIGNQAFYNCTNLKSIVLSGQEIITLTNVNAFQDTLIDSDYGTILVRQSLIEQYKSAPNWSYYKNRFSVL